MDNLPVGDIESQKKSKGDPSPIQSTTLMADLGNPDLKTPPEYDSEVGTKMLKVG